MLAYIVMPFHSKSNGEHNIEPTRSLQNTEIPSSDILRKTEKHERLDMFEHTIIECDNGGKECSSGPDICQ
jgi:hypothetical protein